MFPLSMAIFSGGFSVFIKLRTLLADHYFAFIHITCLSYAHLLLSSVLVFTSNLIECFFLQALFAKLQQLATVAGDVLLGKEKIQKILLARLTETVVMWLSDEQEFWVVFEDDSGSLQPLGLQQVYFFNCTFIFLIARTIKVSFLEGFNFIVVSGLKKKRGGMEQGSCFWRSLTMSLSGIGLHDANIDIDLFNKLDHWFWFSA